MKNEHRAMTECAEEAARIARGVTPDRLAGPTPCGEWDVRTLVNHWVLYTSHGLEHRARREPLSDELTARDFTADTDWAERYAAQLERAVAAWSDPAVWEGEVDLGGAAMPARRIASMIVKEMAVHGWDVARATGQEVVLSDESAAFVLKVVEDNAELYRQYQGFADPVEPAPGATVLERALAASGRDPHWSA